MEWASLLFGAAIGGSVVGSILLGRDVIRLWHERRTEHEARMLFIKRI